MNISATTRMTRLVGLFSAVCLLAYYLGYGWVAIEQGKSTPIWTALVAPVEIALGIAMLLCVVRHADRALRWTSFVFVLVYSIAELTWRPLWNGGKLPYDQWPWHHSYLALAVIVLIPYVKSSAILFAYILIVPAVQATSLNIQSTDFIADVLHGYVFVGFAVIVPHTFMQVARNRDAIEFSARQAAAAAVAAEAQTIERERIDGLIHDSVMSTLLTASRVGGNPAVTADARRALIDLSALRKGNPAQSHIGSDSFFALFRSSLHFLDPTAQIYIQPDRDITADSQLPAEVARTLVAATCEAFRNSLRHAGDCSRNIKLTARATPDSDISTIEITIHDDGLGFSPSDVPIDRLGLRVSIRGRMESLKGGFVDVKSSANSGTNIKLRWDTE